jgi:hypothetical protein
VELWERLSQVNPMFQCLARFLRCEVDPPPGKTGAKWQCGDFNQGGADQERSFASP